MGSVIMKKVNRFVSLLLTVIMLAGISLTPVSAAMPPTWSDGYTEQTDITAYQDEVGQDFRTWLQYDPRWGSLPLGTGTGTTTVGQEGCTITAITKLMIEAGLASPTELNPGVLDSYLNSNGGFVTSGSSIGSLYWGKVSDFASDVLGKDFALADSYFQSGTLSSTDQTYKDRIIGWLNEGYHLVLNVGRTSGTHWIAVDEIATLDPSNTANEVYIMDSWSTDAACRYNISLSDYLSRVYSTTNFFRIAAYKTDPADTDNSNLSYYNTDYYRKYSRYDSRWATAEVDRPSTIKGDYVGEWGQALLSLTKALIASGAVADGTTPNDVLAELKTKSLIGSTDGIIDWTNLESYNGSITDAAATGTSDLNTYATIRDGIISGKHYIVKFTDSGNIEHAWSAIDEHKTLASGDTVYLLSSGKELEKNAGYYKYSDVRSEMSGLNHLYYFTASTSENYVQFNYSLGESAVASTGSGKVDLAATGAGESGEIAASYTLGDETIEVANGGYVPAGTQVIVTTTPPTGYDGYTLSASDGSINTIDANHFVVTAGSGTTTVTAAASPTTYAVTSNDETATCGFNYTARPTAAEYDSTVTFTVVPVNDTYTVSVTAKDEDDNDVAVTQSGNNYSFTQPASSVTVTVSAEQEKHTVFLDATNGNTDNPVWYIYTWTNNGEDTYDSAWLKSSGTTPEGYKQFDGVMDHLIIVRGNPNVDLDTADDKWSVRWNQSANQLYGTDYTDMNNLFVVSDNNVNGTWSEMSGPNTVYLYPKTIDVRSKDGSGDPYMNQFANYPEDYYAQSVDEYYAYTWNSANASQKTWIKGTVDDYGVIKYEGIKDTVQFYRIDPSLSSPVASGTGFWNKTKELTVPLSGTDTMYVLKRYETLRTDNSDILGSWDDPAEISGDDYKLWTMNDSRWATVTLGDQADQAGNYIGEYRQVQAYIKMIRQAGLHEGWDVADFNGHSDASGNADYVNTSGNVDYANQTNITGWGLIAKVDDITTTSSNRGIDSQKLNIYNYLLEGKHVLVRCYKEDGGTNGEWVVVDEQMTLENYNGSDNTSIYVLRTTDDKTLNCGTTLKDVTAANDYIYRIITYTGGTTPGLTRDYDYRRWSINDGRWATSVMSPSSYTMADRGALVVAAAKMMIQSGVYDTDHTPLDFYNFIEGPDGSKFVAGDASLYWHDVDNYSDGFYSFESAVQDGESYIFLKFGEPITIGNKTVTGYPRRTGSSAYFVENEYQFILKAIQQGYHMMLEVHNTTSDDNHQKWLTIDEKRSLEEGDIYVMDSTRYLANNADLTLAEAGYSYLFRVIGYKGATTPIPEDVVIEPEPGDEDDEVVLMSPSLRPDEKNDPVYLDKDVVTRGSENAYDYNFIYGPDAKVRVTVTGVVKGNTYRLSIADSEEAASAFTAYVDKTAAEAGLLDVVLDLNEYALDTTAPGNTGGTKTIYLAVKNVATVDDATVQSNVLTTAMTYKAHELVTGFSDTAEKKLYIYQDANENNLINSVTGYLTADADTLVRLKNYSGDITKNYHITDSNGQLVALSEISSKPGVYTVTLTAASSNVDSRTISTDQNTVLIDPDRSSYIIRVVTPAAYIYQYTDRHGEDVTYTEYLDDTLSQDELVGYAGNNNTAGMPQYISVEGNGTLSNKLISKSPKQVEAGFNKNLRWSAKSEHISLNSRSYAVTLNAIEEDKIYTVTFKYGGGKADVVKTGTYNTLIELSGAELSTVDENGEKFAYWTDDSGRVASIYPGFNMMIAEDATFTAHYGAAPSGVDDQGDGTWEAYNDGVKLSYKIEGNNRKATRTVYTDYSLRFIDGDRRIQKLLGSSSADDVGYVESYGLVVAYDMNEANAAADSAYTALLKTAASNVAKRGLNNVASTRDSSKFRFFNFNFTSDDTITNRNRADVGVPWDYDTYAGKNVVGFTYVIYRDTSGTQQIAVSDGVSSTITWGGSL